MTTAEHRQIRAHHGFQQPPDSFVHLKEQTAEIYQHCSMAAISPIQVSAPEAAYGLEQAHMMPVSRGIYRLASFPSGSHESLQTQLVLQQEQHIPEQQYQQQYRQQQSSGSMMASARSTHNHSETHQMHAPSFGNCVCYAIAVTPHSQNTPMMNSFRPALST
jgi:hypothetical protein